MHRIERVANAHSRPEVAIRTLLRFVAVGTLAACATDAPTATRFSPEALQARAGGAGPTVNSTNPNHAHQGDVLSVRVFGSGFEPEARATWVLAGDTTQVITNSTTFVSSSELVANISVKANAALSLYDVAVTLSNGKKGVGAEKFAVTTAVVLGTGTVGGDAVVLGMNDAVNVVGYAVGGAPFVFDGTNMVSLGSSGQAWGIDPSGTVVVGRDSVTSKIGGATVWTRTAPGVYSRAMLPLLPTSVGGIARAVVAAPNGDLLAGGSIGYQVTKQKRDFKPVIWTRTGSTWGLPVTLSMPGYTGSILDLGENGRVLGFTTLTNGTRMSLIWENPTTYTQFADIANAMNRAATIVVGLAWTGVPIFWYRNPSTLQWNTTPIALPVGNAGCQSEAQDVNDAGIIVGYGCQAGSQKQQAMVWRLDLSVTPPTVLGPPEYLTGLGQPGTGSLTSKANAITNAVPFVVAGEASTTPRRLAVKWVLP